MSRATIPQPTATAPLIAELASRLGIAPDSALLSTAPLELAAAAVDASHYLLTPQLLMRARTAADVSSAMAAAANLRVPMTFRAGGTSLSGQSLSQGLLVDVRRHFRDIEVLDGGLRVRMQPGATVRQVNARLARFGRKLGPDPASEIACTMGGVIANNSSGMTCGTTANTYQTLESVVLVLPSGTIVDSSLPDADEKLLRDEPGLHALLLELRKRCLEPQHRTEIERQYAHKNTMGYGLNSLVDHESPVEMLAHLMVGSEGTLGFVAEATLRTIPDLKHVATSLLHFPTLAAATAQLGELVGSGANVVELLDAASLRVCREDSVGDVLPSTSSADEAALLVEYQAAAPDELAELTDRSRELIASLGGEQTSDPRRRGALWQLRKGLYTKVAGDRPSGTTALLEDVAVPLPELAPVCVELQRMFAGHGYRESVIFGHAKDGNIHFLVNEDFRDDVCVQRYEAFTEDMVQLVLDHGGSLKAEHGTGRIMAPYVERQYGAELFGVMKQVKQACDPAGILNPGSVLVEQKPADEAKAQLLDEVKLTPSVEAEVDRCVECGYCEPVCPSADLTLTPRQRIVVRRAIAQARAEGKDELVATLEEQQRYPLIDTCAVDGMCSTACPLGINTGDLVRRLRAEQANPVLQAVWQAAAKGWGPFTAAAAVGMNVVQKLPTPLLNAPLGVARRVIGTDVVPMLSAELPGGGARRHPVPADNPSYLYLPACVNTMFGTPDGVPLATRVLGLAQRAGVALEVPDDVAGLCCGTPWKSKGMTRGYEVMTERVARVLGHASQSGRLTIVCDATSCTEGLEIAARHAGVELHFMDALEFVATEVLPKLPPVTKVSSAVLHPTCSSTQLGLNAALQTIAGFVADEVVVPTAWRCCAFAGDRGLLHPELTASATAPEAAEVNARSFDLYLSANRTCELGMTRATGHEYTHVLAVLEQMLLDQERGPSPSGRPRARNVRYRR